MNSKSFPFYMDNCCYCDNVSDTGRQRNADWAWFPGDVGVCLLEMIWHCDFDGRMLRLWEMIQDYQGEGEMIPDF